MEGCRFLAKEGTEEWQWKGLFGWGKGMVRRTRNNYIILHLVTLRFGFKGGIHLGKYRPTMQILHLGFIHNHGKKESLTEHWSSHPKIDI